MPSTVTLLRAGSFALEDFGTNTNNHDARGGLAGRSRVALKWMVGRETVIARRYHASEYVLQKLLLHATEAVAVEFGSGDGCCASMPPIGAPSSQSIKAAESLRAPQDAPRGVAPDAGLSQPLFEQVPSMNRRGFRATVVFTLFGRFHGCRPHGWSGRVAEPASSDA